MSLSFDAYQRELNEIDSEMEELKLKMEQLEARKNQLRLDFEASAIDSTITQKNFLTIF